MIDKHHQQQNNRFTLEEIGKLLREARERAGFTKTDVSSRTKITIEQLNHLEEGQKPKIASVYARGFLRTYSELVQLEDAESIYEAYKNLTAHNDDSFDKPLTSKYMNNDFLADEHSNNWNILITTLVVVVVVLGALYISPNLRGKVLNLLPDSAKDKLPTFEQAQEQDQPAPQVDTPSETEEVLAELPTSELQSPVYQGRLTLRAEKTTWAQVVVDDEPIVHLLFEPGQSQSFEGLNSVNVVAGDGQALRMEWNGQDQGYLGQEGPIEVFFTLTSPET